MKQIPTKISDLLIFEPTIFSDERGYFFEDEMKEDDEAKEEPIGNVQLLDSRHFRILNAKKVMKKS